MALTTHTPRNLREHFFKTVADSAAAALAGAIENYSGRTVFQTRFSPEDQVIAHLIFSHKFPVRVFTSPARNQHELLLQSVDYFKGNIEVMSRQTRAALDAFVENNPKRFFDFEHYPQSAPLHQLLNSHHLKISGLRGDQLAQLHTYPVPLEWDEANQQAIFYPLFDWDERQVRGYILHHGIPHHPFPLPSLTSPIIAPETQHAPDQNLQQKIADSAPVFIHQSPGNTSHGKFMHGLLE